MKYKGGALLIGSLLWDDKPARKTWREKHFQPIEDKVKVNVKIRYGRDSLSRNHNYTMVLTNHPDIAKGNAFILPYKEEVDDVLKFRLNGYMIAQAEGFWTSYNPVMANKWGVVGLLFNPRIERTIFMDRVKEEWKKNLKEVNFCSRNFSLPDESAVINDEGLLNIEWDETMNDFDFILATVTKPHPPRLLSSKEINQRMKEKNDNSYFFNNIAYDIRTFQDKEILLEMNKDKP